MRPAWANAHRATLIFNTHPGARFSLGFSRVCSHRTIHQAVIASAPMASASRKRPEPHDRSISPPPLKRRAVQPSISKSAVANFFTPASQKPKDLTVWTERSPEEGEPTTLLVAKYVSPDAKSDDQRQTEVKRRKIAAFDLDSTLITPASGKKHAEGPGDWKWWHNCVPAKLRELHNEGYDIIIFTNQGGLSLHPDPKAKMPLKNKARVIHFKTKCGSVLSHLDIPEITLYAATGKDIFRKPRTGMWEEMKKDLNLSSDQDIDLENSLFVGDAGGRLAQLPSDGKGKKAIPKDFSCSDRNMASNVGIRYLTPEEFFLGEDARNFERDFDLSRWPFPEGKGEVEDGKFEKKNEKELLLFVGPPGAGKSTFFWRYLKPLGYERANQDLLKTKEKCLKAAAGWLEEGESVVVDATNADPDTRRLWVELARKHKVPIRCVWFKTPLELCMHNDAVRGLNKNTEHNPEARQMLPGLAFNTFKSRFKEPKVAEGFDEVVPVEFKFKGTKEEYEIWGRYWV